MKRIAAVIKAFALDDVLFVHLVNGTWETLTVAILNDNSFMD